MGNNVSATVEIDDGIFSPQRNVAGTIHLQVNKATPKKDVVVALSGEEKTFIAPPAADERKRKYTTEMKWILYEQRRNVPLTNHSGATVQPGEYKLRFECPVPPNAPTSGSTDKSFLHHHCRLRHMIRVFIDSNKEVAKAEVPVVSPSLLPLDTPTGQMIRPYKAGSGNISVGFAFDTTCVKPGGTLYLKAVCRNRSNLPVQKIKAKIVERKFFKTQPPVPQRGAHYLTDQIEKGYSDVKVKEGPGLAMAKLTGRDLKEVQPLVRSDTGFIMEPSVLKDITATLGGMKDKSGIPIQVPEGINCSYNGRSHVHLASSGNYGCCRTNEGRCDQFFHSHHHCTSSTIRNNKTEEKESGER